MALNLRRVGILVAMSLMLALTAACSDDTDADSDGAPPSPTPGVRTVLAPIDELELVVRESFPPQYSVRIVSGIPSGCAQFKEAKLTGTSGTTFTIEVTNTEIDDPNAVCTAIYGMQESFIDLGSDLVSGTEYTVNANDKSLVFTAL